MACEDQRTHTYHGGESGEEDGCLVRVQQLPSCAVLILQSVHNEDAEIIPDKTIIETKRYRVYSLYIKRYFSPQKFTHIEYQNASCYLLKNNDNVALSFDKSNELLNKIIEEKIALN
jgi:hypothetical protein